jgi:hypothetical protein
MMTMTLMTDSAVLAAQLETPRGRYDEHNIKYSLSMKPRFIEPVGERTNFRRLMLASLATARGGPKILRVGIQKNQRILILF